MKYCKRQTFKSKSHQSGAALIIALLIVFIVASLSVAISSDFLVMIRRVENQVHSNQAYAYLVGAEGLARYAILQDDNLASDHLGELFLSEQIVLPLTHADQIGQYSGSIEDLQGRLNINNLLSAAGSGTPYSVDQQRFIRLLQTLELEQPIDQPIAIEITHAVIDWLDPDSNQRQPGGAEDLYYGDAIPAGKAANRGMVSITELRWVKGVTLELYEALKPHITVWGNRTVNINTATDNVLKSLNEDKVLTPLSDADFETLVAEIATAQDPILGGLKNLNIFNDLPLKDFKINKNGLSVVSEAFLLTSELIFLDRQFQLNSVIKRESGKATVIARTRTSF